MNSAAAMALRIDTPISRTRCELRPETTAPRSRSTTFSAGASCSMLLLPAQLALVRVALHELPVREPDAEEHPGARVVARAAAALGTRLLRGPVFGGQRAPGGRPALGITAAWHTTLHGGGPQAPTQSAL